MAAVSSGPLNYVNGRRVESANSNTDDDITVLEPATGYLYILILCTFAIGLIRKIHIFTISYIKAA